MEDTREPSKTHGVSVKKSAEEILAMFGSETKLVFNVGNDAFIKRKEVGDEDGKGGKVTEPWLVVSGFVYDKVNRKSVLLESLNFNGAFDVKRFDDARREGNTNFTVNVKFGKIQEKEGFKNLPIFVKGIEKCQKTIDFVGNIGKVEEKEKSTRYFVIGKKDESGTEPLANVVVTEAKVAVMKGLALTVGQTLAVHGDLVTTFKEDGGKREVLFPKVAKNSLSELKAELGVRKTHALKLEEGTKKKVTKGVKVR